MPIQHLAFAAPYNISCYENMYVRISKPKDSIGYTYILPKCPGVKSVSLEGSLTDVWSLHAVLHAVPNIESLELGLCLNRLLIPSTCSHLNPLSVGCCPDDLEFIFCATLTSLSICVFFGAGNLTRSSFFRICLAGTVMSRLASLRVTLQSYAVGDKFMISLPTVPGRTVCSVLSYQGKPVGDWGISVSIQCQRCGDIDVAHLNDLVFKCIDVHDMPIWDLQS